MTPLPPRKTLLFQALLTKKGWLENAYVTLDDQGVIVGISQEQPAALTQLNIAIEHVPGLAIPGFQNAHSHAFQYAMVGMAEHLPPAALQDDFWTWRDAMYSLASRLTPDEMESVAALLYTEMLRHGITAVTEFHYLHQDPAGKPYAHLAEMGERIIAAAKTAGIHVTLVPVMYEQGGFGRSLFPSQKRFNTFGLDGYHKLVDASRRLARGEPDVLIGTGVHSLRAVSARDTLKLLASSLSGPIHLHVAEQRREVEDAVVHLGQRPVQWLLDHLPLNQRFHLVHATHMTLVEAEALGRSGANVVVCPSTEGNLGDGIFALQSYRAHGGGCAFGTDSQIGLSPFEELRWMDYVQRLTSERRNVVCQASGEDSGTLLLTEAWERGRSAMGHSAHDFFAIGEPFDAAVIDGEHPLLLGKPPARRLGSIVYGGDPSCLLGTMRRGRWLVQKGAHVQGNHVKKAYAQVLAKLWR